MKRKIAHIWIWTLMSLATIATLSGVIYGLTLVTPGQWLVAGLLILAILLWAFTAWCWNIVMGDKSSAE